MSQSKNKIDLSLKVHKGVIRQKRKEKKEKTPREKEKKSVKKRQKEKKETRKAKKPLSS